MIVYNVNLFVTLFAVYTFFRGLALAYHAGSKTGEAQKWEIANVVDGGAMMIIAAVPVFL